MTDCDIAIVGAGPYGLAAAAHLRAADSLRIAAFGETMSFWSNHMPLGMLLRSPYVACSISDPPGRLTLTAYEQAMGQPPVSPVPLSRFVDYGRWFQQAAIPELRTDRIDEISRNENGFHLSLESGEHVHATRVIVAGGIADFASYPAVFRELPRSLVSHSSEHDDLAVFADADVLVVGAGQSALESAALLAEAGAQVAIAARAPTVHWLTRRWHHNLGPVSRMLYAPPDVGPAGISWIVATPHLFRSAPRRLQDWMTQRALRAAGSGWLPPRLSRVTITVGREIVEARERDGRVLVTFDDGSAREVDHVLLGTGYDVDVSRYPFLARELVQELRLVNGYPVLGRGFESSVSGLHFLGAPAAWSFGPLMRFVAGTGFAGRELARRVLARSRAPER
jgi:cation diffusion facilitator CzcD-associated flavoprotein CzcO